MKKFPRRQVVGYTVLALAAFAALVLVVPLAVAYFLRPKAREAVIARLEERFDDVRLEELDLELLPPIGFDPHLRARGRGLSLSLPGRSDVPPFITMDELDIEVGLLGLLRHPIHVRKLELNQLQIQIPPKHQGDDRPDSASKEDEAPPPFVIENLSADGTVLRILRGDPDKDPLQFDLHQLQVKSAGIGEPMEFDAVLENATPPGEIDTHGTFGPLTLEDPGSSPVEGEYVFSDADLSVFGGIAGTLHSKGRFGGELGRIEVTGTTDTPDFQLSSAGNPVPLKTEFQAVVDGTNGDTLLEPVEAVLGETLLTTQGGVVDEPGPEGKTVCLDARSEEGRIEDLLRLAMKNDPPLMTGAIRFLAKIVIPSGDIDVVERMVLDGEFAMSEVRFPESEVQDKVDDLSEAGRSGERSPEASEILANERVFSDIEGFFQLAGGVMTISHVSFSVPGAEVNLTGSYGLVTRKIDFQGELRLESELSDTTTGVKSLLLQLVDPLFRRKDAGAVIPIKIGGTPDEPSYGVEIGRVLSRKEVARRGSASREGIWPSPGESCSELARSYRAETESDR